MTQSIATEWLDDVIAELREIGHALAVVAAYVAERDDAMGRGMRREWLVEGPSAPRLGVTLRRAQSYARRFGAGHTIRIGYGHARAWRAIDIAALVRTAQRVAA